MTAPEVIEYVVVPINRDSGEIELKTGEGHRAVVELDLADLGAGLTVIMAPGDLPDDQRAILGRMLAKRQREATDGTKFIVMQNGPDNTPRWDFVRLVRKDKWDADFGEERVERSAS